MVALIFKAHYKIRRDFILC